MNCLECRGACCETFAVPLADLRPPGPDELEWVKLHGRLDGKYLEFECRCTKLTPEGRCSIYESPERPMLCVMFPPGHQDCLEAVRRRRTPEQYQKIRGPEDPPELHG